MSCKNNMQSVENKFVEIVFDKQVIVSQNILESAKIWQNTAKLLLVAIVVLCVSFGAYFWLYNTETTVTEEEETIHYSIEQDSSNNGGTNEMHTIDMGDINYGETESN